MFILFYLFLDLCSLLYTCGVKKQNVLFLLSEFQVIHQEFLHYIAEVISGEITDLFKQSELEKVIIF